MNRTIRIAATVLGIYAGLLGIEHGVLEMLQGETPINSILINAIGPPCQPKAVWHTCYPALTLIPNYWLTGISAILLGLSVLIWTIGFIHYKQGGIILILLSILMMLVGGGFIPAFMGIIAGAAGTRILAPLTWWQKCSPKILTSLSKLWSWTLFLLAIWFFASWFLGYFFNQAMLNLSFLLFICFDLVLPLLIVFSGVACDVIARD
jgi:hypothetical protein